jgi:uncharacterized protein YndB with AHSA1/START domain
MSRIEAVVTEAGDVTVECSLDAPPEKVWRALTVPELAANWLGAQAGTDKEKDNSVPVYEIVEAEPFSHVRYRWRDRDADETDSFVTFELQPRQDGGTWFRLVHAHPKPAIQPANGNSPPLAMAA